jgi:hypothetical protein
MACFGIATDLRKKKKCHTRPDRTTKSKFRIPQSQVTGRFELIEIVQYYNFNHAAGGIRRWRTYPLPAEKLQK